MKGTTMTTGETGREELSNAFHAGRRVGFGISALVLSLVGFLSLLGAEKAILAIVLGALAIRGSGQGTLARRLGLIAICLGIVFLLTLVVVLIVFRGQVLEVIQTLQKLS
jgi:hypothetical protein